MYVLSVFFFFFQAEDGIRDVAVTGVQTCALPISDILDGVAGRPAAPELSMDFEEAIGRLPDGARHVFVLHDIEGYRHEEIADMLGIVAGTSKSQLHHARMALRKHLER